MIKKITRLSFGLLVVTLFCVKSFAQTTLSTTSAYTNNNGTGEVTFNLQNTNTYAVVVTGFDGVVGVSGSTSVQIYYKTTAINGNPGAISAANGWILAGSNTITGIANTTSSTPQPFISGLALTIPASTTYGIVVYADNQRYYTLPAASTISAGGVNMISDATTAWGLGTPPAAPTFSPRGWIGNIYFANATPCSGTPNAPTITSAAITTPICQSATTTINATNTGQVGAGVTYQWQVSSSSTGPFTNVTTGTGGTTLSYITGAQATTMYYRLKDSCGASNATNLSALYTVPVAPTQITSTTPGQRCGSGTVSLSATGTGTGFNWYTAATGGTAIGTGSPFTTPVISATTTYYVASSYGTCEGARSAVAATVNSGLTATATPVTSTTQCTGGSTVINGTTTSGTGLSYQWQLNGSNITGATGASYTATASGSYTVIITSSTTTCVGTSNAVVVTIGAAPATNITPTGTVGYCPGSTVTLSATNTGIGLSYQWYLNGTAISGATAATYAAGAPGNYTVSVAASPTCSTTSPTATSVFTYPVTPVTINTPNGTAVCPGGTLPLNITVGAASATYQWSLNGTAITGATNPSYSVPSAGSYTIAVTYTSTGCTAVSPAVVVTTGAVPVAVDSLIAGATNCDSVGLKANTGANLTYQWLYNGAVIQGATGQQYYGHLTGAYTVAVTNASGCTAVSSPAISIVVNNSPFRSISATGPTHFCAGGIVQLQVQSGTGLTYQWSQNGAAINGATSNYYIASTAGAYTVLVTSAAGCSYTTQPLSLTVNPTPVATAIFNPATYVLSLSGNTPYVAYHWYYNMQPISGGAAQNSTYMPAQPGSYLVAVTDSFGCTGLSSAYYVPDTSIHPTGVNNVSAIRNAIKVFPNPATDKINIESPVAVNIVLRDLSGKQLLEEKNVKSINVSSLAGGLYLLMITDTDGRLLRVEKITKVQ